MEFQTNCKRIGTLTTVFQGFDEQPIDCDFMLPDYLPDITAVLKCLMKPVVQSYRISGDRITAEGTAYLNLLYSDEERRCVHSYEHAQPFTATFTVKELSGNDVVRFTVRCNYVNCRAMSPRRADVHGAFSVGLTVQNEHGCEAIVAAEGDGLFTRGCTVSGTVICAQAEKTVSLNEVVDLGTAPAELLIRNEAVAVVTECRQMPEKAIIKGDVLLHTVYISDRPNGTVCNVENRIPFSQILDVDGLTEEQLCDCRAQVTQCDARLMQDPGGENRLLSVALKVMVSLECYATQTHSIVTDAYHTACSLKAETESVEVCRIQSVSTDTVTVLCSVPTPDGGIAEIVDLWCEPQTATCLKGESGSAVAGDMLIGMIARDSEGQLSYYERSAAFQEAVSELCDEVEIVVTPLETAYTRSGANIEIRLTLSLHAVCRCTQTHSAVVGMVADDAAPFFPNDPLDACCLKVCFASAGESVWELARRERTSPEALKEENGLSSEVLEQDMMLLIPMR